MLGDMSYHTDFLSYIMMCMLYINFQCLSTYKLAFLQKSQVFEIVRFTEQALFVEVELSFPVHRILDGSFQRECTIVQRLL
jgi:hypothetical protein